MKITVTGFGRDGHWEDKKKQEIYLVAVAVVQFSQIHSLVCFCLKIHFYTFVLRALTDRKLQKENDSEITFPHFYKCFCKIRMKYLSHRVSYILVNNHTIALLVLKGVPLLVMWRLNLM